MRFDEYLLKIKSDKLVLVDFNAIWCGPCKVIKPVLDQVSEEKKDVMQLMPIRCGSASGCDQYHECERNSTAHPSIKPVKKFGDIPVS
jgi:thiol-disulfide isomerase/thioredoxin